jgi:acetoin utilization protein AcuB
MNDVKKAYEIMSKKIPSIEINDTIANLKLKFIKEKERFVFILDNNKIKGVITISQFFQNEDKFKDKISEFMIEKVVSVHKDLDIIQVSKILISNNFDAIPVIDDNNLIIGIISNFDIIKNLQITEKNPEISPERLAIYLAMTDNEENEKNWVNKAHKNGYKVAITQVGSNPGNLAVKFREGIIVAAINKKVIEENVLEKLAVSNAARDAYMQINILNPGLGGGFKVGIARGEKRVAVAAFGRCGHSLVNSPQIIALGYSII